MKALKTVLIGYGRIAAGYVTDDLMLKHIKYATHAQVLNEHPGFEWVGIVEKDNKAIKIAENNIWGINNVVNHPELLDDLDSIEVVVLATPPDVREEFLEFFPNLRAVIVEKPLGSNGIKARQFLDLCAEKNIAVAVNISRRYDNKLQELSYGGLNKLIGKFQCCFGVYGNGLINNGTHLVDLVRMLLGEIKSVTAIKQNKNESENDKDINPCFNLVLESGGIINIQSIDFKKYREMTLDIWSTEGRLTFWYETLKYQLLKVFQHPYATDEKALNNENSSYNYLNLGSALYLLYDNLYNYIYNNEPLMCSGEEALMTMKIIDNIKKSSYTGKTIHTEYPD